MTGKVRKYVRNQEGVVLLWSMLVISLLILVVSFLTIIVLIEINQSRQIDQSSQAYMAAEAGHERAINYVRNEQTTGGPISGCTDSRSDGTCNVNYTFEVVGSGVGEQPGINSYDAEPTRFCNDTAVDYCFYTEGVSGNSIRKLDGYTKITPITQSVLIDMASYPSTPPWTFLPDVFPQKVSLMDVTPSVPKKGLFNLSGQIDLTDIKNGGTHYFGLLNNGSGKVKGISIKVYQDSTGKKMKLVGTTINTATKEIISEDSSLNLNTADIGIPASSTSVIFTLTYRNAAANSSDHTVTLQVNNKDDKKCLGVETAVFSQNIFTSTPFYVDFLSGGASFDNPPCIETVDGLTSLKMNGDSSSNSVIKLSNFVFNTSGVDLGNAGTAIGGSCSACGSCSTGTHNLTVEFVDYSAHSKGTDGTGNTYSPPSTTKAIEADKVIYLTVTDSSKYYIYGGDCAGASSGTVSILMDRDKTCKATFYPYPVRSWSATSTHLVKSGSNYKATFKVSITERNCVSGEIAGLRTSQGTVVTAAPILLGDIPAGGSSSFDIAYNLPSGITSTNVDVNVCCLLDPRPPGSMYSCELEPQINLVYP